MEVLRGSGGLCDAHVPLGAEGQEALDARRGVLRTLALEPVGQQQDEPRRLAPLVLGSNQEIVDHDLSTVGEVAELGLPCDKRIRCLDRVTVLEA